MPHCLQLAHGVEVAHHTHWMGDGPLLGVGAGAHQLALVDHRTHHMLFDSNPVGASRMGLQRP